METFSLISSSLMGEGKGGGMNIIFSKKRISIPLPSIPSHKGRGYYWMTPTRKGN
jgi:hypothetical protein